MYIVQLLSVKLFKQQEAVRKEIRSFTHQTIEHFDKIN